MKCDNSKSYFFGVSIAFLIIIIVILLDESKIRFASGVGLVYGLIRLIMEMRKANRKLMRISKNDKIN